MDCIPWQIGQMVTSSLLWANNRLRHYTQQTLLKRQPRSAGGPQPNFLQRIATKRRLNWERAQRVTQSKKRD